MSVVPDRIVPTTKIGFSATSCRRVTGQGYARPVPGPGRILRYGLRSAWRLVSFILRVGLRRYARAAPRQLGQEERPRVFILLVNAWAMGGTIRASHNLATHLARTYDVELLSVVRRVSKPFFPFPARVDATALDDRRRGLERGVLQGILRSLPSTLVNPADRAADCCNLWTDIALVRRLRGQSGFLITTRPGLNLLAAELAPPGLVTVGQEHMHFHAHPGPLRWAMKRRYRRLAALAVLTSRDLEEYRAQLGDAIRLVQIPNAAEIGGPKADLSAKTVLAAGRLSGQKGFDLLIAAFAEVAPGHRDWRLRICGEGQLRPELERLVDEAGLGAQVELPGRCDIEAEMTRASVFALSSRFEGFPVVLIEAMSKGMAVVSFDCPTGPAELVEDHRNGILVPAEDVTALAASIRELIEDEDLRHRCAPGAVETAASYTLEAIGGRWETLLRELADERRARVRLA
jgi:glycosyltransferase involved in cell wall biosynthesis